MAIRTHAELHDIAMAMDRGSNSMYPGTGIILMVFNNIEHTPNRNSEMAVVARGCRSEDVIAILRTTADQIEKQEKSRSRIQVASPLILPPGGFKPRS